MTAPLEIRVTRRAARELAEAGRWWVANRPKAPDAFREEIERALVLIASHPNAGASAANAALQGVRRVRLDRIRYHLYYRMKANPDVVEVLALWHTSRGQDPTL